MMTKLGEHRRAVKDVQRQVSSFYKQNRQARIFHGGTNSTRSRGKSPAIDISRLDNIIEINLLEKYVLVEPNVSLGKLIDATLAEGLVPPVISEFPSITVGGAIQGGAGESSSFKWGCFHQTCIEYEIVLGNGKKITASANQNVDLFNGIACSYGSLGVITLVKLRLIPATLNIKLTYRSVGSYAEAVEVTESQTKLRGSDFVDGIMFSKNHGVIMTGEFTQQTGLSEASFHKFSDDWFYLQALKKSKYPEYQELIPTRDYLFRYDRGAYWMARAGANYLSAPSNRLIRLGFAPIFKTRNLYRFLHGARLGQKFLVQDNILPSKNVPAFMDFIDKNFRIYPLWLCPLKPAKNFLSPTNLNANLVIDVGVWGLLDVDYKSFVVHNQLLEKRLDSLRGRKVLFAHCYYAESDFWNIYDKEIYDKLRKKYSAESVFKDIYNRIHVSEEYEPSVARGWWKLLTGA